MERRKKDGVGRWEDEEERVRDGETKERWSGKVGGRGGEGKRGRDGRKME